MPPAILHRHTFTMREAMSALLADDQVDAEAFEIRVIGNCVVVDLVNPSIPDSHKEASDQAAAAASTDQDAAPELDDASSDTPEPEPEKPKGGALAQRAGIICAEKAFWVFMDESGADGAAAALRSTCGIESRAELDHNPAAAREFRKLVAEYEAWCKE